MTRLITAICLLAGMVSAAHAGPALVFEAKTGKVLYAEAADKPWYPASLTKLMTSYLVFKALKAGKLSMDSKVVSTQNSAKEPPRKIGLPVGRSMSVETALKALIVKSANDVAVMLAERTGGSEARFIEMMNATAKSLGMTRTSFANPNGLPDNRQVTTARDMAMLTSRIIAEFPQYAHFFTLPSMRFGKVRLRSYNVLLRKFEGADGMKTGFICNSGFNIVASATRGSRRLVAIVLGSPTAKQRNGRAMRLLQHGFDTYAWKTLFSQASLESLPLVPRTAGKPKSIRRQVKVWSCGYRPKKQARRTTRNVNSGAGKPKAAAASFTFPAAKR